MRRLYLKQPKNQSGTVLITVVLIAAFVVILVVESIKTIRYQKQLSSNLIHRDQANSYLMGMEELAKIWLKKAFETSREENVHLNQPWAQDDITFPLDGGGMTASITDMQACFNLNSIALPSEDQNSRRNEQDFGQANKTPGQLIFEELVSKVNDKTEVTGQALAAAVRDWIDPDIDSAGPDGAEDDFYQSMEIPYRTANSLIAHVSELMAMKGFTREIYLALLPHLCVLPDEHANQININTVIPESGVLIYAALGAKNITLTEVTQAISNRGEKGFESVDEFISEFGDKRDEIRNKSLLGVSSDYFQMSAQAEIGKTRVAMKTLFKRGENNNFKVVSRYFGKE